MRQKNKGIILLTVGMYLVIMNPIFSMIFNQPFVSFGIELTPVEYWLSWFQIYGSITLIFVIIGAYMIRIGLINLKLEKLPDQ